MTYFTKTQNHNNSQLFQKRYFLKSTENCVASMLFLYTNTTLDQSCKDTVPVLKITRKHTLTNN